MTVGIELKAAIAAEEAKLAELEQHRAAALDRLSALRSARTLTRSDAPDAGSGASSSADWPQERKLALFADLFRGREDVFPLRWENAAKSRRGWAPRCANEWKPSVCEKPRVKCGVCPNQAFLAPGEIELLAHLQGRQVMGVYPLLPDDTCRLLAIDLDGRTWPGDVAALSEACR